MEECIDQEEPVHFDPQGGGTQNVSRAAQDLARSEGGNVVLTLPLRRRAEVVGAVTLEFPADAQVDAAGFDGIVRRRGFARPAALRPIPERPLADHQGRAQCRGFGQEDRRPAAHAGQDALHLPGCSALIFICVYRPMYHVSSPFQFDATDKRKLQVPFDGQIEEVFVRPGDQVKKGQELLTMKTYDLQLELNEANDDMQKAEAEYRKNVFRRQGSGCGERPST